MNTNQPPIVAKGLVRHFGEVKAVDGVDLEVQQGEIFGFLGPNGAGKSTVIRMLTTLLKPTSGSAQVAGFDIATQADKVRSLAEAFAWVQNPNQPHGGATPGT